MAVVLLAAMAADAHADGPWRIALGAGPAAQAVGLKNPSTGDFALGATSHFDAGYRVAERESFGAAVGIHLGLAFVRAHDYVGENVTYWPLVIGLGAQLVIEHRVVVVPWAGGMSDSRIGGFAAGLEAGYDVYVRDHDRIAAIAVVTRSPAHGSDSYNCVGVGVAYRYW